MVSMHMGGTLEIMKAFGGGGVLEFDGGFLQTFRHSNRNYTQCHYWGMCVNIKTGS